MPFYTFICPDCGDIRDVNKSIAERDNEEYCKLCLITPMKRQMSAPAIDMGEERNLVKRAVNAVGKDTEGLSRKLVHNGVTFEKPKKPNI